MENETGAVLHWDDARVFLAIARSGTLSAAAVALAMGIATVSRRLDRLEAALRVPLFSRHQSGYRLTDDGQALLQRAEALEQAGQAFGAAAREQGEVAGHVRLATADNLANPLIIPSLPPLLARHPALRVEIVSGVQTVNLHRGDADLAVRMVKPASGNLTLRRLGTLGYGLYGARGYVQARAGGADAALLERDAFVGWAESHSHLPAAHWLARTLRGRPCQVETTTLSAQVAAAAAGLGLAVLPHHLARQQGLVCVRHELGLRQPIWLVLHTDLAQSRRVRAVADHLIALFEQAAEVLDPAADAGVARGT